MILCLCLVTYLKELSLRFTNLHFVSTQIDHLLEKFFNNSKILKDLQDDLFAIAKVKLTL